MTCRSLLPKASRGVWHYSAGIRARLLFSSAGESLKVRLRAVINDTRTAHRASKGLGAGMNVSGKATRMAENGKSQQTVIKKYANRRLYHTGTSTYVTLEDLSTMVQNGEDFLVYDARSGDDITRSVLTPDHLRAGEQGGRGQPATGGLPSPAHPLLWRQHADHGAELPSNSPWRISPATRTACARR